MILYFQKCINSSSSYYIMDLWLKCAWWTFDLWMLRWEIISSWYQDSDKVTTLTSPTQFVASRIDKTFFSSTLPTTTTMMMMVMRSILVLRLFLFNEPELEVLIGIIIRFRNGKLNAFLAISKKLIYCGKIIKFCCYKM